MYAVIKTGGKQYKVSPGEVIKVEKLNADIGDEIEISDVLLVAPDSGQAKVGQPIVNGAKVKARIIEHGRYKKVIIFKKKRRKGYKVKRGHRQHYTAIEIKEIMA